MKCSTTTKKSKYWKTSPTFQYRKRLLHDFLTTTPTRKILIYPYHKFSSFLDSVRLAVGPSAWRPEISRASALSSTILWSDNFKKFHFLKKHLNSSHKIMLRNYSSILEFLMLFSGFPYFSQIVANVRSC